VKVAVLGASGMLGSMVLAHLCRQEGLEVVASVRGQGGAAATPAATFPGVTWVFLDAATASARELVEILGGCRWAVNAIGVIKPYIRDDNAAEVERAVRVNALFPHALAGAAEEANVDVIQIATDCVYSGRRGGYREADPHDALDVYGKTKSLGEARSRRMHHLRCSIIGPETKGHVSLLDWFLSRPRAARVNGFANHLWNGLTTYHFARLCEGAMRAGLEFPHLQHLVPGGALAKSELLRCLATEYGREDVEVAEVEATPAVDRTLATDDDGFNRRLWAAAGYPKPPSIPQMVSELVAFSGRPITV
jgi:dTDP-4-dehydrorhamnose reductase